MLLAQQETTPKESLIATVFCFIFFCFLINGSLVPVHVHVCLKTLDIHIKVVDQNVFWILIVPETNAKTLMEHVETLQNTNVKTLKDHANQLKSAPFKIQRYNDSATPY